MQLPLTLQLKPSRIFLTVLASGHTLAGVAVLLLPLPWLVRAVALLALALLLLRSWHQATRSVHGLVLRGDGRLGVIRSAAEALDVRLAPATVVLPWLVILHTVPAMRPLVLFPDALQGADAHRQLRVWLKWRAELSRGGAE